MVVKGLGSFEIDVANAHDRLEASTRPLFRGDRLVKKRYRFVSVEVHYEESPVPREPFMHRVTNPRVRVVYMSPEGERILDVPLSQSEYRDHVLGYTSEAVSSVARAIRSSL